MLQGDPVYTFEDNKRRLAGYTERAGELLRSVSHCHADGLVQDAGPKYTILRVTPCPSVPSLPATLGDCLTSAETHLRAIQARMADNTCRILVTGDVNVGKSNFINALLRRPLLPSDQQPRTGVFTEVCAAKERGEEIYYYPSMLHDEHTVEHISRLEVLVEQTTEEPPFVTVFVEGENTIIHNDTLEVNIIDSPGLNRDVIKTLSLFSKQREIDVIVFVVSSENHFTLSSRQFIESASIEKAYIFLVITKFDRIRSKKLCQETILEQVRQLLPDTYKNSDNLVHFVVVPSIEDEIESLSQVSATELDDFFNEPSVTFTEAERCLKTFVLERVGSSKLGPAKLFLQNLLGDLVKLGTNTLDSIQASICRQREEIDDFVPKLKELEESACVLRSAVHEIADKSCDSIQQSVSVRLGRLAEVLVGRAGTVPYPGLLRLNSYMRRIRECLIAVVHDEMDVCMALASEEFKSSWMKILETKATHISLAQCILKRTPIDHHFADSAINLHANYAMPGLFPSVSLDSIFPIKYGWVPSAYMLHRLSFFSTSSPKFYWSSSMHNSVNSKVKEIRDSGSVALSAAVFCGGTLATYHLRSLVGAVGDVAGLCSRIGWARFKYIALFGVSVAVTCKCLSICRNLSSRVPALMAESVLDYLNTSNYQYELKRFVCDAASREFAQAIAECDRDIVKANSAFAEVKNNMDKNLQVKNVNYFRIEEIKDRSLLLLDQVNEVVIHGV